MKIILLLLFHKVKNKQSKLNKIRPIPKINIPYYSNNSNLAAINKRNVWGIFENSYIKPIVLYL